MPALKIENLNKTYKGEVVALTDVSLSVEQGDFFALLGPNGAGKSTMIGIITSLVEKTSGAISIYGHDLFKQPALAKSMIGLVPQEFNFSLFETVEQIVVNQAGYYGVDYKTAKQRAEKYLKLLDLWDKRDTVSRNLSGGMKRRLMIARALLHEPQLLILDEPTAGVDIELRRSMWKFLRELNKQGLTIILTTHYLEEAEMLCRNVAIINHGKIIENTSVKDLLKKLDKEKFILDLDCTVNDVPKIEGYKIKMVDDHTLEVEISTTQNINHLFSLLGQQDIYVTSMRNKTNRLEELFVHIVNN
ncbi:MAG: ABC transporter ATP-binding protein [Gammaproteobacteria bacterium]|nr:MAG: ABC transporter ATP-binding protein [Gammaproteobacteria bacterium]